MTNPIVKALEHGAAKLGKTLGKDVDAPADRVSSRHHAKFGITEWVADGDLEVTDIQVKR